MAQKIVPCLWFDDQAEEAAKFYCSVFKNSKLGTITRYPKAAEEVSGKPAGSVMTVEFEISGQKFLALNGGPIFKFSEAVSFIVDCEDQAEVDYFWEKLSARPESEQCGWCKDKFGLSWQIVPKGTDELVTKSEKAMTAMLKMKKLDLAELQKAADQE